LIVAWTLSPPFPPVSDIQIRRDKGVSAIQITSCECGITDIFGRFIFADEPHT
jgi:hypothetical protein